MKNIYLKSLNHLKSDDEVYSRKAWNKSRYSCFAILNALDLTTLDNHELVDNYKSYFCNNIKKWNTGHHFENQLQRQLALLFMHEISKGE